MKAAFLPDRGVVKVSGVDARDFLNGLVTTDLTLLRPGFGRFGALLTPQGKIIADFLITEALPAMAAVSWSTARARWRKASPTSSVSTDCAPRFRSKIFRTVFRRSWRARGLGRRSSVKPDLAFADPRQAALGWRILIPEELAQKVADLIGADMVDSAAYDAHRIASGVPRGGLDFIYGDAFPHETNMDRLHGVDFDKGCYVGRRWCRGCSIAAPRAPEQFGLCLTDRRRRRAKLFSPATNRWAPWARRLVAPVLR